MGRQESIAEFNLVDLVLKMAFGALATCRWTQDLVFKLDHVIQLEPLVFLSFTFKKDDRLLCFPLCQSEISSRNIVGLIICVDVLNR